MTRSAVPSLAAASAVGSSATPPSSLPTSMATSAAAALVERSELVGPGAAVSATAASAAEPMRGYMSKKGAIAVMFKSPWKRRWFVLEAGELTYYTTREAWQRGEKPLKGHRIIMREMAIVGDDSCDIALTRLSAVSAESSGSTATSADAAARASGRGSAVAAPAATISRRNFGNLFSSAEKDKDKDKDGDGEDESRVWQFVCESKADIDAWTRALTLHGATPRRT